MHTRPTALSARSPRPGETTRPVAPSRLSLSRTAGEGLWALRAGYPARARKPVPPDGLLLPFNLPQVVFGGGRKTRTVVSSAFSGWGPPSGIAPPSPPPLVIRRFGISRRCGSICPATVIPRPRSHAPHRPARLRPHAARRAGRARPAPADGAHHQHEAHAAAQRARVRRADDVVRPARRGEAVPGRPADHAVRARGEQRNRLPDLLHLLPPHPHRQRRGAGRAGDGRAR